MRRNHIWVIILMLVIGFATVVTTLSINGTLNISYNENEFDVHFKDVYLDNVKLYYPSLSEDKKTITFSTDKLSLLEDKSVLTYTVINDSIMYDAKVTMNCTNEHSEYISVTNKMADATLVDGIDLVFDLKAKEEKDGKLTATMIKTYTGDDDSINVSCRLEVEPVEVEEADKVVIPVRDGTTLLATTNTSTDNYYAYRNDIASININDTIDNARMSLADPANIWDVSEDQDGSVKAYLIPNNELYDLYIESDGKDIYLPEDSSYFFYNFKNVTSVTGIEKLKADYVKDMSDMFSVFASVSNVDYELDLSTWNTSNVENISYMFLNAFKNAKNVILDVSGWDTSSVTNMNGAFSYFAKEATGKINMIFNRWDASNVTNASYMFSHAVDKASNITVYANDWNFDKEVNLYGMFQIFGENANAINLNLAGWQMPNASSMNYMFQSAGQHSNKFHLNASNWNAQNVKELSGTFTTAGEYATDFNINVSDWNTENVKKMYSTFESAGWKANNLKLNLDGWDFGNVTDAGRFLYQLGNGSNRDGNVGRVEVNINNADFGKAENQRVIFSYLGSYKDTVIINANNWTVNTTNFRNTFDYTCFSANNCTINANNWNLSNITQIQDVFSSTGNNALNLTINVNGWNGQNVTSIGNMYSYIRGRTTLDSKITVNMNNWDTPNLVSANGLFSDLGCNGGVTKVNVKGFDFTKLTTSTNVFNNINTGAKVTVTDQTQKDWLTANTSLFQYYITFN